MTDFLDSLVNRSFSLMPALEPRRPSRFEMPQGQSPLERQAMPEISKGSLKRGVAITGLSEQNESQERSDSRRPTVMVETTIAPAHSLPPDTGPRMLRPSGGSAWRELQALEEAPATRTGPRQVPVENFEEKQSAHISVSHRDASERSPGIKPAADIHDHSRRVAEQAGNVKHQPRQEEAKAALMEPAPHERQIKNDPREYSAASSEFKMNPARNDGAEVRHQDVHSTLVETAGSYEDGPPIVRVTIGLVEVRAVMSSPPVAAKSEEPRAVRPLSLDEYLRRRGRG